MTVRAWVKPIAMALLAFSANLVDAKDDVFAVPQEQIFAQVNRVGLLSVSFEEQWPRNATAAAEFERLAIEWLTKANMAAVPSSAYAEIEARLMKEAGGWFDPLNGEVIAAKRQSIRAKAQAEFVASHELNGLLELRVDVIGARMFEQKARWHGVTEGARVPSNRGKLMQAFLDHSATVSGSLPALSVAAILSDANGKQLYGRYGGLQLMSLYQDDPVTEFFDVDPGFLFSDPVRNERAIRLALRPLVMTKDEIRKEDAELRKAAQAARRKPKTGDTAPDEDGQTLATPILAARATQSASSMPPLRVSKEEFGARVKTIALSPVWSSVGREIPDASDSIEQAMSEALRRKGFSVVPSSVYIESHLRNRPLHAPYYDTFTGALLKERRDALDKAVWAELQSNHKADAVLGSGVIQVMAMNNSGTVSWDGVSQSFSQSENVFARFNASMDIATGTVPALSLASRIHAPDGTDLFVKRVGVQTLRRMAAMGEVDVTSDRILSDRNRIDEVVAILLEDLSPQAAPARE
jgi:hypothetical protein